MEHTTPKKTTQKGLGKREREVLSKILQQTKVTITVSEVAKILAITNDQATKILSRYYKKGWLSKASRGVYIPVSLESSTIEPMLEDPFAVAEKLFSPCYI